MAALALRLSDGVELAAGDSFPCGWLPPGSASARPHYITVTAGRLELARALTGAWRDNANASNGNEPTR